MAIAIKSVPILRGEAAVRFEKIAATNLKNAPKAKFEVSASTKFLYSTSRKRS
ncbi:MAG: hypothetical protein FWC34_00835 [Bacteroidetes bacterium]|nr:hypothetical protein [Bacteroidota bacterium]